MKKAAKKKLWFKRKHYGWGWFPCSLEGWLVMIVYTGFVVALSFWIEAQPQDDLVMLYYSPIVAATILLIAICYVTGEKPRWQWGRHSK